MVCKGAGKGGVGVTHEEKLKSALEAFHACPDEVERVHLWAEFTKLHAQRPEEVVRQMEQEKGLL
jgi:hypothetical protein